MLVTVAKMMARGLAKSKSHPRAKAVPVHKNLKVGMQKFGERMAVEFIKYVYERTLPSYQLDILGITVTKEELLVSVVRKKAVVTIRNGKTQNIPYWEIWRYFEYGRMDQGVIPDPVLQKIFIDFKPIYQESLKKELTKGRKK